MAALLAAAAPTRGQTSVQWTAATGGSAWENAGNWSGNILPTSTSDVVFSTSNNAHVTVSTTVAVNSLTFSGDYPHYYFFHAGIVGIGAGGISLASTGAQFVDLSGPQIQLLASQNWQTNGNLSIYTPIVSTNPAFSITKTGSGYLALDSQSTFAGGLTVASGTLYLETSSTTSLGIQTSNPATLAAGPFGTGTLALGSNTTIASLFGSAITLANAVNLGNNVLFAAPLFDASDGTTRIGGRFPMTLGGTVTAAAPATTVRVDPSALVKFAGTLTAPINTVLTFTNGGAAILDGTTSATITGIVADGAALFFTSTAALPAANILALNGGYIGMAGNFDGSGSAGHLAPANLIAKITTPATFDGTLGFDSDPNTGGGNTFHGAVNLSSFTGSGFTGLGSATFASLASDLVITPPTGLDYKFGGGGGRLSVASNLTAATGINVSSPPDRPLTVVLQGNNTFTGTTKVNHSYLTLDSTNALPAGATGRVELGPSGYFSATENWAGVTRTAASLLALLNPTSLDSTAILGFDSPATASNSRVLPSDIDLNALLPPVRAQAADESGSSGPGTASGSSLNLPYIGTTTFGSSGEAKGLVIEGDIFVPSGQPLKLAGLNGGILSVTSPLTTAHGITSLIIGHPDPVMGRNGIVRLTGANDFAGGTTLLAGNLVLGTPSVPVAANGGITFPLSPLGTGDLIIDATSDSRHLFPDGDVTIPNNIVVNADRLAIGEEDSSNSFLFTGTISGPGRLGIHGDTTLAHANTYTGGTDIYYGPVTVTNPTGLGTGDVYVGPNGVLNFTTSATIYGLNLDKATNTQPNGNEGPEGGTINLLAPARSTAAQISDGEPGGTGPTTAAFAEIQLVLEQVSDGFFGGQITGVTGGLTKAGTASLTLTGTNSYGGGTTISSGLLIAGGNNSLGTGSVTINSGAALGLGPEATLYNSIVFNGTLAHPAAVAGFGTLASASGFLTIGAGAAISPGAKIEHLLAGGATNQGEVVLPPVGVLSIGDGEFPTDLVFASGGVYDWGIQTNHMGAGFLWDTIFVDGNLTFTSATGTPFLFRLSSYDSMGDSGLLAGFSNQQSYSWPVVMANSITGFDPTKAFIADTSGFLNGLGGGSFSFSTVNATGVNPASLLLNFSPAVIPEPSTYVLLVLGLGLVFLLRPRRRV